MNKRRMQLLAVAMAGSTFIFYQNCSPGFEVASSIQQGSQGGLALSEDIAILSPSTESPVQDQVTLNGRCSTGVTVEITGDVVSPTTAPCLSKTFAATVELSGTDGLKTVSVSQTDASGTTKRDNRTFRKDRKAPVVALTAPVANAYASASLVASGVCEAGLNVSARIATVNYTLPCSSGMFSGSLDLSGVADGAAVIAVSQTDLAGNVGSAQQNFIKDSVRPVIIVSSPAANATVTSPLSIQGTCEAGSDVQLSGSGLTSAVATACTATGTFSISASLSANNGTKSITLNQADRAGNSAVAVTLTVNRQEMSVPPAISIQSPAANTLARTGVTLSGSCVSGLNVTISGAVAAQSSVACTNAAFSSAITFSNGDGAKTVTVSQTNASGTVGSDSRTFLKDNTAPVLTIVSPTANQVFVSSLTITGACENGLAVAISGTGLSAAVNASCANGSYSQSVTLSSGDGAKAIQVRQTDAAANVTTVNVSVVKDATSPVIAFSSPAANTEAETGLTIAGSCETGLTVVINGSGVQSMTTTACASGAFSSAILFSAVDGNKVVDISQTDASGNRGQASRTFVRKALVLDGSVLYAQNCQSCHGALASSTKLGRTASQISAAISQIGPMGFLSTLTSAQVQAIASALQGVTTPPVAACSDPNQYLAPQLKRLTSTQFENSLKFVFGNIFQSVTMPNFGDGNPRLDLANNPELLQINEVNISSLYESSKNITAAIIAQNTTIRNCISATTDTCFSTIIRDQGLRMWRRPVTTDETTRFTSGLTSITNASGTRTQKMEFILMSLIMSPNHLFRSEIGALIAGSNIYQLSDYEIASLLSFAAINAPPDDQLLDLARQGALHDVTSLKTQLTRLSQDARFKVAMANFTVDLLKIEDVKTAVKDASYNFLDSERTALYTSARSSIEESYATPTANIFAPFSNNKFYTNATTAKFFNTASTATNLTAFNADPNQRYGILSHPAFLASISGQVSSGIVKRGVFTLEQMLCNHIGAPPPGASSTTTLPAGFDPNTASSREVLQVTHSSQSTCISCHSKIDPAGFGFENFNALGQFRTVEKGTIPIDSSGTLTGVAEKTLTFANSVDYFKAITSSETFQRCMTKKYFKYSTGQSADSQAAGMCEFQNFESKVASKGKTVQSLLESLVELQSFTRRKPAP